jgi:hypothetical protein
MAVCRFFGARDTMALEFTGGTRLRTPKETAGEPLGDPLCDPPGGPPGRAPHAFCRFQGPMGVLEALVQSLSLSSDEASKSAVRSGGSTLRIWICPRSHRGGDSAPASSLGFDRKGPGDPLGDRQAQSWEGYIHAPVARRTPPVHAFILPGAGPEGPLMYFRGDPLGNHPQWRR